MTMKLVNSSEYADFVEWLRSVLNERSLQHLDDRALCAYLNDMHDDGYIEVSGQYTHSGNPVTAEFPELASGMTDD